MDYEEIREEVERSWERNLNKFNSLVDWSSLRLHKRRLQEIAGIIQGARMAKILKNYAEDYKFWNHGMPDLILWDTDTDRVKFCEVKSENDRLSEVQKAWLAHMSSSQIHCEVCFINSKARPEDVEEVQIFD